MTGAPVATRWTPAQDAILARMIGEGATRAAIGLVLGRTAEAVKVRAKAKGWKSSPDVVLANRAAGRVRFRQREDDNLPQRILAKIEKAVHTSGDAR